MPTHRLEVTFEDTQRTIIVPAAFALPLALASPSLARLVKSSAQHTDTCRLTLPSTASFGALHEYLYLGSISRLFDALYASATSRKAALNLAARGSPATAERTELLERAALLFSLVRNLEALQMNDEALWDALEREWADVGHRLETL